MEAINKGDDDSLVPVFMTPESKLVSRLKELYATKFGTEPDFFVRVPGRVNIIGEHVDYCGYPVLPMAIEKNITIGVGRAKGSTIIIANTNKNYDTIEVDLHKPINEYFRLDTNGKPLWSNYVLCGWRGAAEYFNDLISAEGFNLMIDGNIPPASGLSSSSALVSASCLAFIYSKGLTPNKSDISSLCARCERHIGTQGGGMDQAIAFLAKKGFAQFISWNPLRADPVSLPSNAVFIVAHSLAEINKAATNDFNTRVVECRLAAKVIAKFNGIVYKDHLTLAKVQELLRLPLEDMPDVVLKCLPQEEYSRNEVCEMLDISDDELVAQLLTENTKKIETFKLKARASHVYKEALRVHSFQRICSELTDNDNAYANKNKVIKTRGCSDIYTKDEEAIKLLGKLMRESHESLKYLYECSHDNLDRLVEISDDFGVWCRLTGAGWGGCVVAICPRDKVDGYLEILQKKFYSKFTFDTSSKVFVTTPSHGAGIYCGNV